MTQLSHHEKSAAVEAARYAAMSTYNGFSKEQIARGVDNFIGHRNDIKAYARKLYPAMLATINNTNFDNSKHYVSYTEYAGFYYFSRTNESVKNAKKNAANNWVMEGLCL